MAEVIIKLSYRHDSKDTCTGDVGVVATESATPEHLFLPFDKVPYRRMLRALAIFGRQYEATSVIIKRLDRPELLPMKLDEATTKLMKEDMVAFIHALCVGDDQPIVVDLQKVREAKAKKEDAVPRVEAVLMGGHDTLAEAIGDNVYCRMNEKDFVECPLCGRWHLSKEFSSKVGPSISATCPHENLGLTFVPHRRWAVISIAQLLNLPMVRYYLPRGWNPTRGWISKQQLTELYRSSVQERRNA
jgi:hypothetical protein